MKNADLPLPIHSSLMGRTTPLTPHSHKHTPHPSQSQPHPSPLTVTTTPLTPHSHNHTPHPSQSQPHPSPLTVTTTPLTPHSHNHTPHPSQSQPRPSPCTHNNTCTSSCSPLQPPTHKDAPTYNLGHLLITIWHQRKVNAENADTPLPH